MKSICVTKFLRAFCLLVLPLLSINAQSAWQADLDSKIQFYQTTDFGIMIAGTQKSLYAIDGKTGETLWRRGHGGLDETAITPVPDTDLILLSLDAGDKARLEAVDIATGSALWQSVKVKGDVMQLAVDPDRDLLCVVLVKKAKGRIGDEFKRTPVMHILQLSTGNELWKKDLDSDVEMMPANFDEDKETVFTLDNYRAPLFLDGKLYLFYEGSTVYDGRSGKEIERDRFKVNEDGLALTEADPVFDEKYIYMSGHGKVRAVSRTSGKVDWEAKDLGVTPEMYLAGQTLYVRTGGQFTRLKDGETQDRGSYGISAIDTGNGKTKWRYKDAGKGLTNFVFSDENTILFADKNEITALNAQTGKLIGKEEHKVEKAAFILINEKGWIVVGGREEISAYGDYSLTQKGHQIPMSTVRYKPPGRGALRIVAGIAARAAALYFRYGGAVSSGVSLARNGLSLARTVNSFRWSGLRAHFSSLDLTTLAANSAQNYLPVNIRTFGALSNYARRPQLPSFRPQVSSPSGSDVKERLLDRLDPARQLERLSDYFLRRKRLSELRGQFMYFYTDLPRPYDRKGLAGVNVNNGFTQRYVLLSDPDPHFVIDEAEGLLYSADGSRLTAYGILSR
jgi:outer membrane protein assembly factor BamB